MNTCFSCGLLSSNTYVVWEEQSREGMIIDCGVEPSIVKSFTEKHGINVKYIVLTHGHFDHCDYIEGYAQEFPSASVLCHRAETEVLYDIEGNLSFWGKSPRAYKADYSFLSEGDTVSLGKETDKCLNFKVLHTPGHTPGSICLLDEKNKIMYTGDTLFKNSYGRVDFKYGNPADMRSSLMRLYSLDKDITFYPGHYEKSTIREEIS